LLSVYDVTKDQEPTKSTRMGVKAPS